MEIKTSSERAFTLVEMAVVVALIAMLIGGVLMGRHMVRSSQLNAVLTDKERFGAAIAQFQQRYNALPGDFREAETYWGSDASCPNTAANTVKKVATCNGDGTGRVSDGTAYYERFRFWQHLSNAGFIQESFTGAAGSGGAIHSQIGINVPKSRVKGGGYTMQYNTIMSGNANFFDGTYDHILRFGAEHATDSTKSAIISTAEAQSLDLKADDGLPGLGMILSYKGTSVNSPGCASTDVTTTATYVTASQGILCSLVMKMGL